MIGWGDFREIADTDTSTGPIRISPDNSMSLDRYQRALLNVSRSMQLADEPPQGYLSSAHIEVRHWHTGLALPPHAKSVAQAEADAIGARQMLFVPLPQFRSDSPELAGTHIVIVIWWKDPPATSLPMNKIVSSVQRSQQVQRWAGGELRRLREGDATRYQLLIYLRHIEQFLKGKGPSAIRAWKEIDHNTGPFLVEQASQPIALSSWLQQTLSLDANPMNAVPGVTTDTPVSLRGLTAAEETLPISSVGPVISSADAGAQVKDGAFAEKLVDEALTSIGAHDSQLTGVQVDVTRKFCHMTFQLTRGRPLEIFEYFAIRRGLFLPTPDGLGIGLALFSRRASMQGAFRSLYVSPDGGQWQVDVAVPILRPEVEQ